MCVYFFPSVADEPVCPGETHGLDLCQTSLGVYYILIMGEVDLSMRTV